MHKYFKTIVSTFTVIIFLALAFGSSDSDSKSSTIESTENALNDDSNAKTSSTCNICGREFNGRGYEEQTNGNFKELEYPYSNQLCSPSCARKASQNIDDVANKYGIDLNQ